MPVPSLLTFMTFLDAGMATQMAERLTAAGLYCQVRDDRNRFDVSFAFNKTEPAVTLELYGKDFRKAERILETFYEHRLESVESDYYLFSFTNAELLDIVSKPDEWGQLDYTLAQKILADRDCSVDPAVLERLKSERTIALSYPEPTDHVWIIIGYVLAVAGGIFGLLTGAVLATHKKTLPDGSRVFVYNPADRQSGKRMMLIGCLGLMVAMGWRLARQNIR